MDNFLDMCLGNYDIFEDITNKESTDQIVDGSQRLFFDAACSKSGSSIKVIIESLDSKIHPHAFKLQFECINNEAEYESLIQALELEKNMGIRCLWVFGDSELVINQVNNRYGIKTQGMCYKSVALMTIFKLLT